MARHQENQLRPVVFTIAGFLALVVFAGFWLFATPKASQFRTVPLLDMGTYLENANSLRGDTCQIDREVVDSLDWSPTTGRMFAVTAGENPTIIPILTRTDFNLVNIQNDQNSKILLAVNKDEILRTKLWEES